MSVRTLNCPEHYPLDIAVQAIHHPLNSSPTEYISLHFRQKDVVGGHIQGFAEVQIDDIYGPLLFDVIGAS